MIKFLRIVIVDDQPNIRKDLRLMLETMEGVVVVAEAVSVRNAAEVITATSPDLVFMDIDLGDGLCFDLLEQLQPLSFRVIFLTGYGEYAIRAIKCGALDYLLKPAALEEVRLAVSRAWDITPVSPEQWRLTRQQCLERSFVERIALPAVGHWHLLPLSEILYAEGTHGTVVHMAGGDHHKTIKSLADIEKMLPETEFIRVHQSYLVNLRHIKTYYKRGEIQLSCGICVPVSARRRESVEHFLRNEKVGI
ncbi:LytR/AlgR family response regulator transcription factor [Chitinophaga sp. NPDC101104]|uniref:LytR/AlgR family response regulator transcription factor n=1 Tax=Chitinophaga sp. NPDC101104 TaxID=3390561 RepID=UPI003D067B15